VLSPPRLLGAAQSLLRRRGVDRRQVILDVRQAVTTEVRRRRLDRRPQYIETPGVATEAEVTSAAL
jgi:hypothetical protein